jgi:hypothetical protein
VKAFPEAIPVTAYATSAMETTTSFWEVVVTGAPEGVLVADWLFRTAV